MPSVEELRVAIVALGEEIKSLKGAGAGKDKLQPIIDKLLGKTWHTHIAQCSSTAFHVNGRGREEEIIAVDDRD